MAKAIHHMPKDSALGIQFCIVNSVENPSITQQAVNLLKKLKRNNREKLIEILDEFYDGWPLLHFAAEHGNATICRMLLEYGAKPNLRDQAGDTALHRASRREHLDCIDILCSFGADVLARNNEGKMPMQLAEDHGKTTAVGKLVAMAEKTHVIGPMVKDNLKEITANKDAIKQNQSSIQKHATAVADLSSKVMQLTAELGQLKGEMVREDEEPQDQHLGEAAQYKQLDVIQDQFEILDDTLQPQHHGETAALHDQSDIFQDQTAIKEERVEAYQQAEAPAMLQKLDEIISQMAMLQEKMTALHEATLSNQRRLLELQQSNQEQGNRVNRLEQAVFQVSTSEDAKLYKQLRSNYRFMLTELDGWQMRGALFEMGVLNHQELGYIRSSGNEEQQLESLLLQLFSKDPSCWVKPFLDALTKIDKKLYKAIVSTEDETSLKEPV